MPGKAKKKGKKRTTGNGDNPVTWEDLARRLRTYIAKQSDARTADKHPVVALFNEYAEREKTVKQVIISVPIQPIFLKAVMKVLIDFKWTQVTSLCFWNINCGDAGAEYISEALHHMPWITKLEMLDCNIGPKGCFFLGKALANAKVNISILRLDMNPIEGMGVKWLSEGLQVNSQEASQERPLVCLFVCYYCYSLSTALSVFDLLD
jgi:hypothetical protein